MRHLYACFILSYGALAYIQCAAGYTHGVTAYTHSAAAYMVSAAAYMGKVRIKLTQSNWAGAGTELGNKALFWVANDGT